MRGVRNQVPDILLILFVKLQAEPVPRIFFRRGEAEFKPLAGSRMIELKRVGQQGDFAGIVRHGVFPLAYQRIASGGELTAYLMGAAGYQLDSDKCHILGTVKSGIV